ncbi:MAG TPA: hypothetical protein VEA37_13535 [Flavobacterium sp.]|nr:hypothetical protein [Flavobacterium sp.]
MTVQTEKNNFLAGKHWVIVLVILCSSYGIYTGIRDLRRSQKEEEKWTDADKQLLVKNCIRDSKEMGVKYPDLTRNYCDCSIDKIMSRFTKAEYIGIIDKSIEEQKPILLPVFQDCLTDYQNKIKEAGR